MDYETEEQQVQALKDWWDENGKSVIAGVVLGGAVIGGWVGFGKYQESKAVAGSDLLSRSVDALRSDDTDAVLALADEAADDHSGSLYGAYTNLMAARAAVADGKLDVAAEKLEWVTKNASQDDVKLIATVRLARVKAAQSDASAGLSLLPSAYPASFTALVEEVRGDLHVMAGDRKAAHAAYTQAQQSDNVADPSTLSMKLNELADVAGDKAETS